MHEAAEAGNAERYSTISYWLETCGDALTPRAPLPADLTVDVAILGGGFSGLWTAYFLARHHPGLEIAIIERDVVGFGASGRNGSWCSPRFPVDAHALIARYGVDTARRTILALEDAVVGLGRICAEEGIDAGYRHTGLLSLARSERQMDGLRSTLATYGRLGMLDDKALLGAAEAQAMVHATNVFGGLRSRAGAVIHPGRLVRGLARAVEARGVQIFENTRATEVRRGSDAAIVTDRGTVRARRAIVTAGEAYLPQLPGFRRSLLPMSSMIILSEPLTDRQWEQVGWAGGECLSSLAATKDYLTRTSDGRILYGSRGAPYQFGSKVPEAVVHDETVFAEMRSTVRTWWPCLSDLRFTHAWGGYLGVPRDWMPTVTFDPDSRHGQIQGYTGRGVSTSALSGRLLAGLIGGHQTGLETLPLHRPATPQWEPEPFRWLGVRYVQNAFMRIDKAERAGRKLPLDASFAKKLGDQ